MDRFLQQLQIQYKSIGEPKSGYRNTSYPVYMKNGQVLNFIIFKNEPDVLERIRRANLVGDFLSDHNLPSRKTYKDFGIIKLKNRETGYIKYGCIYEYLDGQNIPWESYASLHIKLLGGEMAKMHKVLKELSVTNFPNELDIQKKHLDHMSNYFQKEEVINALGNKLNIKVRFDFNKFNVIFNLLRDDEQQVLHMDFVRSNLLFEGEQQNLKISGILDFEKTSVGPRILDIARTLAFLITDCKYKKPSKVWKYFLHNGYEKRGELFLPDLKYLMDLIEYFWIYDFYKFLKYNPYEFLNQNEHFLRTKKFLHAIAKIDFTSNG